MIMPFYLRYMQTHIQGRLLIFSHICTKFFLKNLSEAIRFMLLSTLSFALMNALIKELNYYSPFQLVFFRSIGSLVFTTIFLKVNKISFHGKKMSLLLFRGIAGVISMVLFFSSGTIHFSGICCYFALCCSVIRSHSCGYFLERKNSSLAMVFLFDCICRCCID